MIAGSFNHLLNVIVSLLMVPLLLHYLAPIDFVVWSVFITFGAITLQFETAIQHIVVREIARAHQPSNQDAFHAAIRRAQRAYHTLATLVATLVAACGFAYLNYVAAARLGTERNLEWMIFIVAYAISYAFGANSAILLATSKTTAYFIINSVTRTINLVTTYALLKLGLAVLGLALSFAASVFLGCLLLLNAARGKVQSTDARRRGFRPTVDVSAKQAPHGILRYTSYVLAAFLLYKGCFLVATAILPVTDMGGYALGLQACTILSSASFVPVQVWLRQLVRAIASGDHRNARRELTVTLFASSVIYLAGAFVLLVFGETLLSLIGSRIALPASLDLMLICAAFYVELLILVLASYLVTLRSFDFVATYLATSLTAMGWVIVSLWITDAGISILVGVPLALQLLVCLPIVLNMVCRQLGVSITAGVMRLLHRISQLT